MTNIEKLFPDREIGEREGEEASPFDLSMTVKFGSMRIFFSGAMIVLAMAPSQMATSFEPGSLTPIGVLISQQSRTQRIQFAAGAVSTVVEGSVVRGTRNIYVLRARGGQTMTIKMTSFEQNAVFDIQAPNGKFLQEEATSWRGELPVTGDYSIIVGGTRGNASYKVNLTIK